jgi:hypothetical protein
MKFGGALVVLILPVQFSADFQSIGAVIVLQALPAVFFGLMTGWFHRGALIAGMLVGLGYGLFLLYNTPQYSADLTSIVRPHFGGSLWPLAKWWYRQQRPGLYRPGRTRGQPGDRRGRHRGPATAAGSHRDRPHTTRGLHRGR